MENERKAVVIYHSQTGFTERYARWIGEETGADCFALSAAKKKNLAQYDVIIFGGWACAGSISKIGWFRKHMDSWGGRKLIVFCVGGSPMDTPEIESTLEKNFSKGELEKIHLFYCPGGFHYEKMSVPSRLMMKMFIRMLKARKDKTKDDEEMIRAISSSYDISDRKYIKPILECIEDQP